MYSCSEKFCFPTCAWILQIVSHISWEFRKGLGENEMIIWLSFICCIFQHISAYLGVGQLGIVQSSTICVRGWSEGLHSQTSNSSRKSRRSSRIWLYRRGRMVYSLISNGVLGFENKRASVKTWSMSTKTVLFYFISLIGGLIDLGIIGCIMCIMLAQICFSISLVSYRWVHLEEEKKWCEKSLHFYSC